MKTSGLSRALGCALTLAAFGWSSGAPAVELRTVVSPIYQVGTGSQVRIGHTALASTNYNRLYAGGSFTVACGFGGIAQATGANFLSAENYFGKLQLNVTIPQVHPAYVNLTGFYTADRGETIHCAYNWISRAEEGGYSVGAGGISFQTGNGRREEGGSQPFVMIVRDTGDVDEGSTCIP
jgi:hypothetical protein